MADLRLLISDRREDASGDAGRLYDRLATRFGETQVLMDTEAIAGGEDFSDHIARALAMSNFILAVIGPRWLDVRGKDGYPRLRNPHDVVRQEVRIGLESGVPIYQYW
jgi:hypothetical protein